MYLPKAVTCYFGLHGFSWIWLENLVNAVKRNTPNCQTLYYVYSLLKILLVTSNERLKRIYIKNTIIKNVKLTMVNMVVW